MGMWGVGKENDGSRGRDRRRRARLGAHSAELGFRPTRIARGPETNIGEARPEGRQKLDGASRRLGLEPTTPF